MSVRGKTGSPAQSQKGNRRDRDFRIKVPPGTRVKERQILATQRDLDYHPGLNVRVKPESFFVCTYSTSACLFGVLILLLFMFCLP